MKNKKNNKAFSLGQFIVITVFIFILYNFFASIISSSNFNININGHNISSNRFNILISSENEIFKEDLYKYAKEKKFKINIDSASTLEIIDILNSGKNYDAVWISNSIWLYQVDKNIVNITDSKSTSINPIIFAMKKSKAEKLGFVNKDIYMKDILNSINNGQLKFNMSNPTKTNSGASAYLGILSTLAGNPEVLTANMLDDDNLKEKIVNFFKGQERVSGDEDYLEKMFIQGNYDAVISYESSIININKKLTDKKKETLYAIYPIDGVSLSDSPFAYIDHKNDKKKEIFLSIQEFLLGDIGQKMLTKAGRRTWFGGINENVDKKVFNPNWGIDTTKYINGINYPSKDVITKALILYQTELRKPVHVVFALDFSGSMYNGGEEELKDAMEYILSSEASRNLIQFNKKDIIDVITFSSDVNDVWIGYHGDDTEDLREKISNSYADGATALYPAAIKALELLKDENLNVYSPVIILMTDGRANIGSYYDLQKAYRLTNKNIPIYSISFGNAYEYELNDIANLTNGKVFDGKSSLIEAFKTVREYS